jgi:hypothetical protein
MDIDTDNIIESFDSNGSITIYTHKKYFNIILSTSNSYFYCINDCGSHHCHCKDKDWIQGTWNGLLLNYCDDYSLAINIFNFLKIHFSKINHLDRRELSYWFDSNFNLFFNTYYSYQAFLLKYFIKYLFYLGIFNVYFYHNFKNIFFNKFKNILHIDIQYSDDFFQLELNNDLSLSFQYDYDNDSLLNKSFDSIKNIHYLYHFISNKDNFVKLNNDINFDSIHINQLLSFFKIFSNYLIFPNFKNTFQDLQKNKSIDLFFKFNNLDHNLIHLFNIDYIIQLFDTFDNIHFTWNDMTRSTKFSF